MKRKSLLCLLSAFLFYCLFASNLFAQDKPVVPDQPAVQEQTRVIEERLVLSDPTVAQPSKWLIGISGEYWYVHKGNDRYVCNDSDCTTTTLYATGSIAGRMPGGTLTLGYDKLTLSYSYRTGSFDAESTLQPAFTSNHTYQPTIGKEDQREHEITMRLLLGEGSPHFNPYLLLGYSYIDRTVEETLVNPGWTWNVNGKPTLKEYVKLYAPFVGFGAIIPFNKYIGMRLDGRLIYAFANYAMDGTKTDGTLRTSSEHVYGGAAVGTFYWAIWQGLNVQVGGKWQYTSAGQTYIDASNKFGAFGMLGYTLKF